MSFGITELIVILAIVVLLFGTTKLKSLGSDLGTAIKGFKNAITSDDDEQKLEGDAKDASPNNQTSESSESNEESRKVGAGKE